MERVTLSELKEIAENSREDLEMMARRKGRPVKIYLHWTAGHYHSLFDSYHVNIDGDGVIWVATDDLSEVRSHTWGRNTGSVGVALCCACYATSEDLGDEPPTAEQVDVAGQVVCVLANALGIPVDKEHVLTHGEAADNEDGGMLDHSELPEGDNGEELGMYGPKHNCERWDLEYLGVETSLEFDPWREEDRGGSIIRGKAIWYQQNGIPEEADQ